MRDDSLEDLHELFYFPDRLRSNLLPLSLLRGLPGPATFFPPATAGLSFLLLTSG